MNEIFNRYYKFIIIYIDDVLILSENIDQHFKHINVFINAIKYAGLVVSAKKINICQTKIRFLGHHIHHGTLIPIERSIQFADKFSDIILDKTELQRFLDCLNYIVDFYENLALDAKPLYDRLKKNPPKWTNEHTQAVQKIKLKAKELPCLTLAQPNTFKITECDASELGLEGILKQRINITEQLVRYTYKA
ncbi:hypothetical protein AMTRI_Chr11g100010 [Amborella trichopoda]